MNETSRKPRLIGIQVCRGIAVLMVFFAHLHNAEVKYCSTNWMRLGQYGVSGVDLFFVISGVVIASVVFDKFGKPDAGSTFLYHRVARIYPIYWVYSTVALLAFLYNPNWFNNSSGHQVNILASYSLLPSSIPLLIRQGWTLSYEVYFYLVVGLLLLTVSRRNSIRLIALWGLIIAAAALFIGSDSSSLFQMIFSPMVFEFIAGLAIFHLYRQAKLPRITGGLAGVLAVVWLSGVILYNAVVDKWHGNSVIETAWMRVALYGPFAVLLVLSLVELERNSAIKYPAILKKLGDWSYSIYLSHLIIVEICARLIVRLVPHGASQILIIDLVSLLAVITTGYLSYTFIERPLTACLYTWTPSIVRFSGKVLSPQSAD